MKMMKVILSVCLIVIGLSYSHYKYSKRADAARVLPEGVVAKPGRIYFESFPENCLALDIWGWHPIAPAMNYCESAA